MTLAPDAPPLDCHNLADAVTALRERGLRLSTSRRLVLEALFAADGPVSAELITRRLRLELTSVYRNLETLERHGLVRHVHLAHGPGLYALRGQGEREYLYCEHCGAVRAVAPEELDPVRERVRELGYEAQFTHFAIVGTCPACSTRHPRNAGLRHPTQGARATMDEQPEHVHSPTHTEHDHEHGHGDQVHSHPHPHQEGLEDQHEHAHKTGDAG